MSGEVVIYMEELIEDNSLTKLTWQRDNMRIKDSSDFIKILEYCGMDKLMRKKDEGIYEININEETRLAFLNRISQETFVIEFQGIAKNTSGKELGWGFYKYECSIVEACTDVTIKKNPNDNGATFFDFDIKLKLKKAIVK